MTTAQHCSQCTIETTATAVATAMATAMATADLAWVTRAVVFLSLQCLCQLFIMPHLLVLHCILRRPLLLCGIILWRTKLVLEVRHAAHVRWHHARTDCRLLRREQRARGIFG